MLRTLICTLMLLNACADPCRQVAEQVCACQPDQSRERSCLTEVGAASEAHEAGEADLQACQQIIEANSCTCEALALGELKACGLAEAP